MYRLYDMEKKRVGFTYTLHIFYNSPDGLGNSKKSAPQILKSRSRIRFDRSCGTMPIYSVRLLIHELAESPAHVNKDLPFFPSPINTAFIIFLSHSQLFPQYPDNQANPQA